MTTGLNGTDRRLRRSDEDRPLRSPEGSGTYRMAMAVLKGAGIAVGLTLVALPALTVRLELLVSSRRNELFPLWGQALALVPGLPGKYLRKCYYALALRSCPLDLDIGFLSYFNDRRSEVGRRVYVGGSVGLGYVRLGDGCMMGSRVSVINGGKQHAFGPDGRLTPFDRLAAPQVRIGADTWLGEGAIIMADIGDQCIVGAGSVVSRPVPDGCLIAGNPARFIRRLVEDGGTGEDGARHPVAESGPWENGGLS